MRLFKLTGEQTSDFIAKTRKLEGIVFGEFMVYLLLKEGDAVNADIKAKEFLANGLGISLDKDGNIPQPYDGCFKSTIVHDYDKERRMMIGKAYFDFSTLPPTKITEIGFHEVYAKFRMDSSRGSTVIFRIVNEGFLQKELKKNYFVYPANIENDINLFDAIDEELKKITSVRNNIISLLGNYAIKKD